MPSSSYAQKWIWGREARSASLQAWGDPEGEHTVATDAAGNAYVTGFFYDTLAFGTFNVNDNGFFKAGSYHGFNGMLVKYDANGNVIWTSQSQQASSSSSCLPYSVTTDNSGDIYVTGFFNDTISFGAFTLRESSTANDFFLVKYNSAGTVLWAKQATLAVTGISAGGSVTVDPSGNVYVTGYFSDTVSFGAITVKNITGNNDVFLAKYDASGNVLWVQQGISTGAFHYAQGYSVATDTVGNVYMAGSFVDALKLGSVTLNSPEGDAFIAKYNPSGNLLWAAQSLSTGASSGAGGVSVSVDGAGGIYLLGTFYGNTAIGKINFVSAGNVPFLAKYSAGGGVIWAKQANRLDANTWYGFSLKSDTLAQGGGYMVSFAEGNGPYSIEFGSDTFNVNTAFQSSTLLLKFDSTGRTSCGQLFTEGDEDDGDGLAMDKAGKYIYMAGDLDTTAVFGTDTLENAGPWRGEMPFIARWKDCCGVTPTLIGGGAICSGDSVKLTATGGGYVWSTGATTSAITVRPSSTTTFVVTVSVGSCSEADSAKVVVNPVPVPVISPTRFICAGSSATLTASGATSYIWQPALGLNCTTCSTTQADPASAIQYTVTLSNGMCISKDSVLVNINPRPVVSACCDTTINAGTSVQLTSSGGGSYLWSPSNGLSCNTCANPVASPDIKTTYTLTVSSDSGCAVQRTVTIDINCGQVFIPEAFSPNGDGQNDVLYVRGDCIKTLQFEVFDRWGNRVFETESKSVGWDGRCRGEAMNTGSYVFHLKATLYDGSTIEKHGNVALVR